MELSQGQTEEQAAQQVAKEAAASTWAVDNKTIYNPDLAVKDEQGAVINNGPVADLDAARKMANTENQFGRERVGVVEKQLAREASGELSEEQKKNIEIMNGVEEKYPGLLTEVDGGEGRKMLVAGGIFAYEEAPGSIAEGIKKDMALVFSKDGILLFQNYLVGRRDGTVEQIDWKKFADVLENGSKDEDFWDRKGNSEYATVSANSVLRERNEKYSDLFDYLRVFRYDLGDKDAIPGIKDALRRTGEVKAIEEKKRRGDNPQRNEAAVQMTAQEVIKGL